MSAAARRPVSDTPPVVGSTLEGQGTVVILTGPSSVGKTSIAECLRRITPRPAVFLSGDDLDLPPESEAVKTLRGLPSEAVAPMEAQFHFGYFGALASFAVHGLHAIGEVLFKNPDTYAAFERAVDGVPSLVVHLRCGLPIRLAREFSRGDRAGGIAELTTRQEWVPPAPDLVIDTAEVDVRAAADLVLAKLR